MPETPAPHTDTRLRTRTPVNNHARALIPRKGACGAASDSNLLHLLQRKSRERWRAENRAKWKKQLAADQPGLFRLSTLFWFFRSLWYFRNCLFLPPHWPDFSWDSAERKGAKQEESPGEISAAEETSLCAERRASGQLSAVRLCAVATEDRTRLRCGSPSAYNEKGGGGGEVTCFCESLEKI